MNQVARTICVSLLAIAALNLAAISDAQAEPEFQALETVETEEWTEEDPVHATLTATQVTSEPVRFTLNGFPVRCTTVTATGTLETGSSPTMALSPTASGCKGAVFFPAEVSWGSCGYAVHGAEELESDLYKAKADLTCPAGKEITIVVKNFGGTKSLCVAHVPPQSGLSTVKVEDVTAATPDDITAKNEVGGIKVTIANGEEACPITPGFYENGQLTGNTTVTAKSTAKETPPINYDLLPSRNFHFASEAADRLVGVQDTSQEFSFSYGKVVCTHMVWEQPNYSTTASKTIELYGESAQGCKRNGAEAGVEFNNCRYKIEAKANEQGIFVATTSIICSGGQVIEVSSGACLVTIPPQTGVKSQGLSRMTFENLGTGAGREARAGLSLRGLEYEEVEGLGCKALGVKTTTGRYDGSMFIRAAKAGLQVGLWAQKTP